MEKSGSSKSQDSGVGQDESQENLAPERAQSPTNDPPTNDQPTETSVYERERSRMATGYQRGRMSDSDWTTMLEQEGQTNKVYIRDRERRYCDERSNGCQFWTMRHDAKSDHTRRNRCRPLQTAQNIDRLLNLPFRAGTYRLARSHGSSAAKRRADQALAFESLRMERAARHQAELLRREDEDEDTRQEDSQNTDDREQ